VTNQELERAARHRLAIIRHAQEVTKSVSKTCRHFGVSRTHYYKRLRRFEADGVNGLRDHSKRPLMLPQAIDVENCTFNVNIT
jgi:transposase-like protein